MVDVVFDSHLAAQVQHEFQGILQHALQHTFTDASTIVTSSRQLLHRLLTGEVDPLAVLEFVPHLKGTWRIMHQRTGNKQHR